MAYQLVVYENWFHLRELALWYSSLGNLINSSRHAATRIGLVLRSLRELTSQCEACENWLFARVAKSIRLGSKPNQFMQLAHREINFPSLRMVTSILASGNINLCRLWELISHCEVWNQFSQAALHEINKSIVALRFPKTDFAWFRRFEFTFLTRSDLAGLGWDVLIFHSSFSAFLLSISFILSLSFLLLVPWFCKWTRFELIFLTWGGRFGRPRLGGLLTGQVLGEEQHWIYCVKWPLQKTNKKVRTGKGS